MVFGAALAAFLIGQPDSALERLQLFMSSSPAFESTGHVTMEDVPRMAFEARWQKHDQVFKIDDTFELVQTDEAVLLIDHRSKSFQEYRGFPYPVPPNAKVYFYETFAYPWFLTDFPRALKALSSPQWKTIAKGAGWVMTGKWVSEMGAEDAEITLNERGIPTRVVRRIATDDGPSLHVTHEFESLKATSPFPTPSLHAAPGYQAAGLTKFLTASPGEYIAIQPLREIDGKSVDLASLMGGKGVTLLFTAPDCEVSARSAADLKALRADLDKAGYPVQEISLGAAAPSTAFSGARLFHDADANLERKWGIPSTPYMLCIDKRQAVIGAWEGWWPGCKAAAVKSLTTPLEEEE